MRREVAHGVVGDRGAGAEEQRIQALVGQLEFPARLVEGDHERAVVDRHPAALDPDEAIAALLRDPRLVEAEPALQHGTSRRD